jgi:hypothetical protein
MHTVAISLRQQDPPQPGCAQVERVSGGISSGSFHDNRGKARAGGTHFCRTHLVHNVHDAVAGGDVRRYQPCWPAHLGHNSQRAIGARHLLVVSAHTLALLQQTERATPMQALTSAQLGARTVRK